MKASGPLKPIPASAGVPPADSGSLPAEAGEGWVQLEPSPPARNLELTRQYAAASSNIFPPPPQGEASFASPNPMRTNLPFSRNTDPLGHRPALSGATARQLPLPGSESGPLRRRAHRLKSAATTGLSALGPDRVLPSDRPTSGAKRRLSVTPPPSSAHHLPLPRLPVVLSSPFLHLARSSNLPLFTIVLVALLAFSTPRLRAADAPDITPPATATPFQREWANLKAGSQPRPLDVPDNANSAQLASARSAQIKAYIKQANLLRAFRQQNPDRPEASEAKQLEALVLLHAAYDGDDSERGRRNQLVAEIEADNSVPEPARFRVVAYARTLEVFRGSAPSLDERLAAHEDVARELITEFPNEPTAYESLLGMAQSRSEAAAAVAARELLDLPKTPTTIRQRAQTILNRQALVGLPVIRYVSAIPEAAAAVAALRGQRFLIYTWATWSPRSIELAKTLALEVPDEVGLLGVNLDTDVSAAHAVVISQDFKGEQLYDPDGTKGKTAAVLTLTRPCMVFLVDAEGLISSVSVHRDLTQAIAKLSGPQP